MAEVRYIKTKMWRDDWFSKLTPKEQLLFIFLVTNEATRLSGFYEMPIDLIAFHTKLPKKDLIKLLPKLRPQILYIKSWVCIKNYAKHQNVMNNEKVQKLIEREMASVPPEVLSAYSNSNSNSNSEGIDTLSITHQNDQNGDKSVEKTMDTPVKIQRTGYGEFKNVFLSDEEKGKLIDLYGRDPMKKLVEAMSRYLKAGTGKRKTYDDYYAALRQWAIRENLTMVKPILDSTELYEIRDGVAYRKPPTQKKTGQAKESG